MKKLFHYEFINLFGVIKFKKYNYYYRIKGFKVYNLVIYN